MEATPLRASNHTPRSRQPLCASPEAVKCKTCSSHPWEPCRNTVVSRACTQRTRRPDSTCSSLLPVSRALAKRGRDSTRQPSRDNNSRHSRGSSSGGTPPSNLNNRVRGRICFVCKNNQSMRPGRMAPSVFSLTLFSCLQISPYFFISLVSLFEPV